MQPVPHISFHPQRSPLPGAFHLIYFDLKIVNFFSRAPPGTPHVGATPHSCACGLAEAFSHMSPSSKLSPSLSDLLCSLSLRNVSGVARLPCTSDPAASLEQGKGLSSFFALSAAASTCPEPHNPHAPPVGLESCEVVTPTGQVQPGVQLPPLLPCLDSRRSLPGVTRSGSSSSSSSSNTWRAWTPQPESCREAMADRPSQCPTGTQGWGLWEVASSAPGPAGSQEHSLSLLL